MSINASNIDTLLAQNLIVRIDEIISELGSTNKSEKGNVSKRKKALFSELVQTILKHIGEEGYGIEDLFRSELPPKNKSFIVACLFRLFSMNIDSIDTIKRKIFVLMDDIFVKDDVYKTVKIDVKDQTYEKENRLCDAISEIEESFTNILETISTPKQLLDNRQEIMKKFNHRITKAMITPFLPPVADDSGLNTFFQIIKDYVESNEISFIENYQQASEVINELLEEALAFPTKYSKTIIIALFQKGQEIIKKDFDDSPLGKPAEFELQGTGKKYPLYSCGEKFNFTLVLENKGPGHAREVKYSILDYTDNILIEKEKKIIGSFKPGKVKIELPCQVVKQDSTFIIDIKVEWMNAKGMTQEKCFQIEALSQRADVDWAMIATTSPYSLEAVSLEEDLIGRGDTIEKLITKVRAKSMGSFFLYGQKRVGKTSVAKVLKTCIDNLNLKEQFVVYLECGNFIDLDSINTVNNAGKRICREIKNFDTRLKNLNIPEFHGALTPLTDFLEDVLDIIPDVRILFILDEFDELPIELFKRDEVGKAFFLPIRTISNKNQFGFLLVGGENMDYVINSMGDHLNKFTTMRIDYFSREKNWQDFQDLIKRPVFPNFEFTDQAINRIYEMTAGNPYYTNLICTNFFSTMIQKHDAHVTEKEIEEAIEQALDTTEINSFSHFWQDGITEKGSRKEDISIRRKKILISLGEIARNFPKVTKEAIIDSCGKQGLEAHVVEAELKIFERRQILVEDHGYYLCKARFFQEWLKHRGIKDIMITLGDYDEQIEERKREEQAFIKPKEINELIGKWGVYQGKTITQDDVREWLIQFGDNRTQRLMFYILQNIKIYGNDVLRLKMKEAHKIVKNSTIYKMDGKKKRSDILVSYLDGVGKSGAHCARLYSQENDIYFDKVIEQGKIRETLDNRDNIQALVFIDDIIGSGSSAIDNIKRLTSDIGDKLNGIKLFFIAVCGFEDALGKVEEELDKLPIKWKVSVLDTLTNENKCFSDESSFFPTTDERIAAHKIAMEYGKVLEKKNPLGFGDVQANVIFESNCPNNCLPIIYKKTSEWRPLFERK